MSQIPKHANHFFLIVLALSTVAPSVSAQKPLVKVAPTAKPLAACCVVTAVNAPKNVAAGKENITGQTFTFSLQTPLAMAGLRVGQAVYANFVAKQVSLDGSTVAGTILSVASPAPSSVPPASTGICPGPSVTDGIDVASFQGTIDWQQVRAAGVKFAYVHVSDGISVDPTFAQNYAGARSAGLLRGAYQTFHPSVDVIAQANTLIAAVATLQPGDLPPVLHLEATDNLASADVAARATQWLQRVQQGLGRTPVVSSTLSMQINLGTSLASYPLWTTNWGVQCPAVHNWNGWAFWQYSATGSVPGIAGSVHLDRFNGSSADLSALASR